MNNFRNSVIECDFTKNSLHIIILHKDHLFTLNLRFRNVYYNAPFGSGVNKNQMCVYVNKTYNKEWLKGKNIEADFYDYFICWNKVIYPYYENRLQWIEYIENNFDLDNILYIFKT